ncbi:Protein of unknown function [Gryllus bimaculatus]|nr:Protein of unknown function [Gryllus bimaculatus]
MGHKSRAASGWDDHVPSELGMNAVWGRGRGQKPGKCGVEAGTGQKRGQRSTAEKKVMEDL